MTTKTTLPRRYLKRSAKNKNQPTRNWRPASMADATRDDRLGRITLLTRLWPWLFLTLLLVFFEAWAQIEVGRTFLFSGYNVQAILLAASAPLLLALGQTFVIITAGIDLSVGFVMGLAAVTVAQVALLTGNTPLALALGCGVTV